MGHLLKIKCADSSAHFSFNTCLIYTLDGASAKFSTNSHETDNSAVNLKTKELCFMNTYTSVFWMKSLLKATFQANEKLENLKSVKVFLEK